MAIRALIVVAIAAAIGCHSTANGTFEVTGPPQTFHVPTTTCRRVKIDPNAGTYALDLFTYNTADDTELVLDDDGVLVRIPGAHRLVRLTAADCTTLDVDRGDYSNNFRKAATGHVTLDCTRAELGHVVGTATFTCFK